jgi:hypothetical protein
MHHRVRVAQALEVVAQQVAALLGRKVLREVAQASGKTRRRPLRNHSTSHGRPGTRRGARSRRPDPGAPARRRARASSPRSPRTAASARSRGSAAAPRCPQPGRGVVFSCSSPKGESGRRRAGRRWRRANAPGRRSAGAPRRPRRPARRAGTAPAGRADSRPVPNTSRAGRTTAGDRFRRARCRGRGRRGAWAALSASHVRRATSEAGTQDRAWARSASSPFAPDVPNLLGHALLLPPRTPDPAAPTRCRAARCAGPAAGRRPSAPARPSRRPTSTSGPGSRCARPWRVGSSSARVAATPRRTSAGRTRRRRRPCWPRRSGR